MLRPNPALKIVYKEHNVGTLPNLEPLSGFVSKGKALFSLSLSKENIKDEKYVILNCPLYNAQRTTLFRRLEESFQGFHYLPGDQKFKIILSDGNDVQAFLKPSSRLDDLN